MNKYMCSFCQRKFLEEDLSYHGQAGYKCKKCEECHKKCEECLDEGCYEECPQECPHSHSCKDCKFRKKRELKRRLENLRWYFRHRKYSLEKLRKIAMESKKSGNAKMVGVFACSNCGCPVELVGFSFYVGKIKLLSVLCSDCFTQLDKEKLSEPKVCFEHLPAPQMEILDRGTFERWDCYKRKPFRIVPRR